MKIFLLLTLFVSLVGCISPKKQYSAISGLDTFGSKRLTMRGISSQYGDEINNMVLAMKSQRPEFAEKKKKLEAAIKNQYGLAFVHLSHVMYFSPQSGDYVTVDVVEPEDVNKRMKFLPEPRNYFQDPDGLIDLWDQYLQLAFDLQRAEDYQKHTSCPAWHCTHGFEHPKLRPFLDQFQKLVPINEKKLVQILKNDSRSWYRANAAFLLAHAKNGKDIVSYLLPSVHDSADVVRNNATRVLSEIASKHPEIDISLPPILKAMNYPMTTDRNKAAYVLVSLSAKEKNRKAIIESSGETLIEMLKLEQPNNRQPAYEILKNISGQNYSDTDYKSWAKWLKSEKLR